MRKVLSLVLKAQGYEVKTAGDGKEGMVQIKSFSPDLVFSDLKMPDADGIEVLQFVRRWNPDLPVIILTAFGTVETAVKAMKIGASDYVTKPVDNNVILEKTRQAIKNARRKSSSQNGNRKPILIGSSDVMKTLAKEIELVARTNTSVLITGESGTGKELAARSIQRSSERADRPFVRINCAAIPKDLMESELFGYRKGAFTGAVKDRKGAFINANGGTLFLDEIGDMPVSLQAKLLHAVEDKTVISLGATEPVSVDVKIISATNQDILRLISEKRFRSDLYYRLNGYTIQLQPLRKRKDDIPELVEYFLTEFSREFSRSKPQISKDALKCLAEHAWPGNVRELKNIVERLALVSEDETIDRDAIVEILPRALLENTRENASRSLYSQEVDLIRQALDDAGGNVSKAARSLGITRNTLRYRMKKYNLND